MISPGSETKQVEILDLFGLSDCKEGKQMATNAILKAFGDDVTFSRKKRCYKNLRKMLLIMNLYNSIRSQKSRK